MKKSKPSPVRNPAETTGTFNMPKVLKLALQARAEVLARPMARLVQFSLEHAEKTKWAGIELGVATPEQQKRIELRLDELKKEAQGKAK